MLVLGLSIRLLRSGSIVLGLDDPRSAEEHGQWRNLRVSTIVRAFEGRDVSFVCMPSDPHDFVHANAGTLSLERVRLGRWPWDRRATIGTQRETSRDLLARAALDDDFEVGILSVCAGVAGEAEQRRLVATLAANGDEWELPEPSCEVIATTTDYHIGLVRPALSVETLEDLAYSAGFDRATTIRPHA